MTSFLDAAGIERHENYNPWVSAERRNGHEVLLEITARIRACFYKERFCCLMHTRDENVECAMHAYLQSFIVDWSQVGVGGELGRADPYLYYDWASGRIANAGARQSKLPLMDDDGHPSPSAFKPCI